VVSHILSLAARDARSGGAEVGGGIDLAKWAHHINRSRQLESTHVKMIIAIIQPTKLSALREALLKIGVERMTVCDAQGFGRQLGHTETYRGVEYKTHLLRKIALEIAVNDDFLDRTLATIESVARTGPEGNIGDGKIFVLPLDHVTRIGGVATGPGAV
jgi:nitrogen regulatory protein P-II 1